MKLTEINIFNKLGDVAKELPLETFKIITELPKIKSQEKRIAFLKQYPDLVLQSILKVVFYLVLSSGKSLIFLVHRCSSHISNFDEVKKFTMEVEEKVNHTKKITYQQVSNAVDTAFVNSVGLEIVVFIAALFLPFSLPVLLTYMGFALATNITGYMKNKVDKKLHKKE